MKLKSILGTLMPTKSMLASSIEEARVLATRWDVPQANREGLFDAGNGQMLPLSKDLQDRQSRYILTSPDSRGRQYRVAGRMLAEDLGSGSTSVATPLLFGVLGVFAMLTTVLPRGLGVITGALALATLLLIRTATAPRKGWAVTAALFGLILPVVAASPGRSALYSLVCFLPMCLMPLAYSWSEQRKRAKRLAIQGRKAGGEDGSAVTSHVAARKAQAIAAAKDDSPLITIGETMGKLTHRGDGFAADEGLPMSISLRDLSTHMIIFGETGSGKTSTQLRPKIVDLMRARRAGHKIGLLLADGKGALAGEHVGMRDYVALNPRHEVVSLYQGLSASDVARQHEENNLSASGSAGSERTWNGMTAACCRPSSYMLEALVKHQICDKSGQPWKWSLLCHDRLGKLFLAGEDGIDEIEDYWTQIAQREGVIDGMLQEAYLYSTQTVQALAAETRGSVLANWTLWFAPYLSHPDLMRWAAADTGAHVEACLHGQVVGLDVNGSLYGQMAASLVVKFLKARILNELQQRAGCPNGDWQKVDPTATPCFLILDEFQDIQTTADSETIPKSRSLGGHYICATQSIESLLQTSKNENATKAMLASLLSRVAMRTSPATAKWMQEGVGMGRVPHRESESTMVDFVRSVAKAYSAPVWDEGHPMARLLSTFRRKVGGTHFKDARIDKGDKGVFGDHLANDLVLVREMKEDPILELSQFSTLTSEMGVAFASVRRGGVPRRDYVRVVAPMSSIPDDLLDPDYAGRRDLNAEDAEARQEAIEAALAAEAAESSSAEPNPTTTENEDEEEDATQHLTSLLNDILEPKEEKTA